MLLILEIVLTIVAWNKGWKWKSLIPVGSALLVGFIYGILVGMSGGEISPLIVIGDIAAIIILAIMCGVKPKNSIEK